MNALPDHTGSQSGRSKQLQEKWGDALRQGFVVVPWVLLRRQSDLGLTTTEMVVLLHLLASWWDPKKAPYPSSQTIAKRIDVTPRTVQRSVKNLEKKGLLRRLPAAMADHSDDLVTRYDLQPLVQCLTATVKEQIAQAQEASRAMPITEGIA